MIIYYVYCNLSRRTNNTFHYTGLQNNDRVDDDGVKQENSVVEKLNMCVRRIRKGSNQFLLEVQSDSRSSHEFFNGKSLILDIETKKATCAKVD